MPYKNSLPCDDTVRLFRDKHRELTLRNYESKDLAKIKGERFLHVERFFGIMESIGEKHPGLLGNGDRVWNLDETEVDPEFGEKIKVFCDSSSHHGGSRAAGSGSGRHVTAVIAASASGKVCPPFFLVQGTYVMSNWFLPLDKDVYSGADRSLIGNLQREGWFPEGAAMFCTAKSSMEMTLLPLFIRHLNKFVRRFVPEEEHYLLTLDGHGSRKGYEWVEF